MIQTSRMSYFANFADCHNNVKYFIKKVKRSKNVNAFKNRNNINRTSEIMPATVSDTV